MDVMEWALAQMPGDPWAKLVLVQMASDIEPPTPGMDGGPWWYDGSPFRMARLAAQCSLAPRQFGWALSLLDDASLARPDEVEPGVVHYRLGLYWRERFVAEDVKNHAPIPRDMQRRVLDRDGHRCLRCGSTERLHVDHIYPRYLGGWNIEANLQTLCRACNLAKGADI